MEFGQVILYGRFISPRQLYITYQATNSLSVDASAHPGSLDHSDLPHIYEQPVPLRARCFPAPLLAWVAYQATFKGAL